MGTFSHWLRQNSEHYLVEAAQRDLAQRHLRRPGPVSSRRGPGPFVWRRLFVPVYRLLPWGLRRRITQAMPGSHRQSWRQPPSRTRKG